MVPNRGMDFAQGRAIVPTIRVFEVDSNAGLERRHKRGESLIFEGLAGLTHLHIQSGWAFSYVPLENGDRQVIDFHIPGDMIALTSTDGADGRYVVEALNEVSVKPVALEPAQLLRIAAANEARLIKWLTAVGHRTAYQRVAHLLCELNARLKAVGLASNGLIMMPVLQEHLGQALGLTPVHVNRMLRLLKDEHVVRARIGRIEIIDPDRLKQIAGFDGRYLTLGISAGSVSPMWQS